VHLPTTVGVRPNAPWVQDRSPVIEWEAIKRTCGQRPCRLVELVLVHVVRLLVDPQIRPREQRWQSLLVRAHPEKHTPPSQFGPLRVTALDAEHNLTSARGLVDPFLDVDDQPLPPP